MAPEGTEVAAEQVREHAGSDLGIRSEESGEAAEAEGSDEGLDCVCRIGHAILCTYLTALSRVFPSGRFSIIMKPLLMTPVITFSSS